MKFLYCTLFSLITMSVTGFTQQDTSQAGRELRHVVLFSFKKTSTENDIKKVEEAFRALPSQIREIKAFEWGLNNSPEKLNQDFTHCFLLTFASEQDRAVYLPHPAHKAFGEVLKPHLDKVLVFDYWTRYENETKDKR